MFEEATLAVEGHVVHGLTGYLAVNKTQIVSLDSKSYYELYSMQSEEKSGWS